MCCTEDFEVNSVNYDVTKDSYTLLLRETQKNVFFRVVVKFDDLGMSVRIRDGEVACMQLPVANEFHLLTIVAQLVNESIDNYHG